MSKERVDIVKDYDELSRRFNEHWERLDRADGLRQSDGFVREPSHLPQKPARPTYDFEAQQNYNLIAKDYVKAEAFGRKALERRRPAVKASGNPQFGSRLPPHRRAGQADLPAPTLQGQERVPGWKAPRDQFEDPGLTLEAAIDLVESRGLLAAKALASGIRMNAGRAQGGAPRSPLAQMPASAGEVAVPQGPPPDVQVDPRGVSHVFVTGRGQDHYDGPGSEITSTDFTWGDSYFVGLVNDISVVGGMGADWTDVERTLTVQNSGLEVTLTQVAFGRPS